MILTRHLLSTVSCGRIFGAHASKTAIAVLFGIALVPGLDLLPIDSDHAGSVRAALQAESDGGSVVVMSLTSIALPAGNHTPIVSPDEADADTGQSKINSIPKIAVYVPGPSTSAIGEIAAPITITPGPEMPKAAEQEVAIGRTDEIQAAAPPAARGCDKIVPDLASGFQSILKRVAALNFARVREYAALAQITIIGTASTYNPFAERREANEFLTSSGEVYDPAEWTAAIRIDLRPYFGGVRYGRNYQPAYALVENSDRQIIVKINDVGPLRPGRVIDLNERSMRYFDPSLQAGLIHDTKVTLLPGDDWTPGPVGGELSIRVASAL